METKHQPFDLSGSTFLPGPLQRLATKLFVPEELVRSYSASRRDGQSAAQFTASMLRQLNISYEVTESELARIPKAGAAVLVANHPFGLLEGLILVDLLEQARPDFRIVANGMLANTPALHEKVFFVNPFEDASVTENGRSLRACLEWLRKGGLLVMFPAGEVSHLLLRGEWPVADPEWNSSAARFARKMGCPAVPLFFDGANSVNFQLAGAVHPRLRTLNLAHELVNKRSRTIRVRVGTAVPAAVLSSCEDAESATAYLRARTYLLSKQRIQRRFALPIAARIKKRAQPVALPLPGQLMAQEVEQLPPERTLVENGEFKVVLARAQEIPNLLREIGRCRELAFREVGEGTGKDRDLDKFDQYYEHLVLWHAADQRLAGGYRLAATSDVLPLHGTRGLYTSTLFRYQRELFDRMGPAIELGRSFVAPEYQKLYAPLLLLWKAIAAYVQRRPECAVLFGAVSISGDYQPHSRRLMVDYLRGHGGSDLTQLVRARRGYARRPLAPKPVKALGRLMKTLDELSASVQDLELDGKGVPVLIRQYMKIGGQCLGFNVDPQFSHALDALVMADLRQAGGPMLERLMGKAGAKTFREWHSNAGNGQVQP